MIYKSFINWIKEIISQKDDSLVGLTRLRQEKAWVQEVKKVNKPKKDVKISDLIKGEIY